MAQQQWLFHWENAAVHTAASMKDWMAAKEIRLLLEHPPYLLDLFRLAKEALAGIMLDQESLKNAWEGVARNITADNYATAFQRWFDRVKKYVRITCDLVEKS
jgi:hypothetical protein